MKILISDLICIVYIGSLRIILGENKLTAEEFKTLSETQVYKDLIKSKKFIVKDEAVNTSEVSDIPRDISEMNVAELKAYGKTIGLEGISQMNKVDLLTAINEALEE